MMLSGRVFFYSISVAGWMSGLVVGWRCVFLVIIKEDLFLLRPSDAIFSNLNKDVSLSFLIDLVILSFISPD